MHPCEQNATTAITTPTSSNNTHETNILILTPLTTSTKGLSTLRTTTQKTRKGAVAALVALLIAALFAMGAMAINLAYIQLARAELMVATDASARAGGRAMSFYQDAEQAKQAAQITAALNTVAGETLRLSLEDSHNQIEFGDSDENPNSDRYRFNKVQTAALIGGGAEADSVRITGAIDDVPYLFPTFNDRSTFNVGYQSVAMQVDRDIALVLDRSGSMDWKDYNWPQGISPWSSASLTVGVQNGLLTQRNGNYYYAPGVNSTIYQDHLWAEEYELGPTPNTPWEDLVLAVEVFLDVLEGTDQQELVSLATYSSTATLDMELEDDYDLILEELSDRSPAGSTAIGDGLSTAIPSLLGAFARPFAAKTIIVMTDGIHNRGTDPETVATNIVAANDVTIHSVTFTGGADIARMQAVANIGGGSHYHAATGQQLVEVFEEIANNLPTIMTK